MSPTETSQINRRFDGFRNTPFLWEELLEGLKMYKTAKPSITDYPKIDSSSHIRLGKLIEQFVLFELEQDESTQILKSNIQIFSNQITIGELDCLIKHLEAPIHLEIVYKFYLYDPSNSTELHRWVGPNRNDSLVLKLHKLKEKQLPLLYHPETAKLLNKLNIKLTEFKQRVFFKAQLFVPFNFLESSFKFVNRDCINGFYMKPSDLKLFKNHTYYIPSKLDWVVAPHLAVTWISAQTFQRSISALLASHKSPLCWMKSPEGKIQKFFVVWW
ncbi:DUF1853 family protein [Ascidiimonas sp. W6]|uniref:DUF1853 family protein n=1 Tax=Ascidiimonas meishanensis TaxID=3128903 RepID=UPI0030ED682B